MTDELDGMATFLAVAETKGFRAAGERLRAQPLAGKNVEDPKRVGGERLSRHAPDGIRDQDDLLSGDPTSAWHLLFGDSGNENGRQKSRGSLVLHLE